MIEIGRVVPDFQFESGDGPPIRLSEEEGHPLLLIFLRHLA